MFLLKQYFEAEKKLDKSLVTLLRENDYIPYRYQWMPLHELIQSIEKHNGVIIADVGTYR